MRSSKSISFKIPSPLAGEGGDEGGVACLRPQLECGVPFQPNYFGRALVAMLIAPARQVTFLFTQPSLGFAPRLLDDKALRAALDYADTTDGIEKYSLTFFYSSVIHPIFWEH